MPEPITPAPSVPDTTEEVKVEAKEDMFGNGEPLISPTEEKEPVKEEKKEPVTIKDDPYVKTLEKKIEDYGTNLSGQGKIIKELQAKLSEVKDREAKEDDSSIVFKEIKTSKDLTSEEKEEMTDAEIKQFDVIAELQESVNELAKAKPVAETKDTNLDLDTVDDFSKETKAHALKIAGDDVDLANKIINEFNQFANNEELSRPDLLARIEKSAKLVPDYKAPKEQTTSRGKTVTGVTKADTDGFNTDAVIEQASQGSNGSYPL